MADRGRVGVVGWTAEPMRAGQDSVVLTVHRDVWPAGRIDGVDPSEVASIAPETLAALDVIAPERSKIHQRRIASRAKFVWNPDPFWGLVLLSGHDMHLHSTAPLRRATVQLDNGVRVVIECDEAPDERGELVAALARLLRANQWACDVEGWLSCKSCGAESLNKTEDEMDHKPGCELARALRAASVDVALEGAPDGSR